MECDTNATNPPPNDGTADRVHEFSPALHSARYRSTEVYKGAIFYTCIHSSRYDVQIKSASHFMGYVIAFWENNRTVDRR
jgi:hypothetical protein